MEGVDLEQVRTAYLDDESWQVGLSDTVRKTLRELVRHPAFAGSTEPAALTTLALLVSRIRPASALQIGTHVGFSALFLADLMRRYRGDAQLIAIEPDEQARVITYDFIEAAELGDAITIIEGFSTDDAVARALRRFRPFPLVYLDSSHAYRGTLRELEIIFEREGWVDDSGLLVLHDAAREAEAFDPTGEGGVRRALDEWMTGRGNDYQLLILEPPLWDSGCGIGLMRRSALPASRPQGRRRRLSLR